MNLNIRLVAFPFYIKEPNPHFDDARFTGKWVPGVKFKHIPPDDSGSFADGIGVMVIEIVSRHKPGKYPERIFYTRSWIDPDGNEFGKKCLRVAVASKFNRMIRGYSGEFLLVGDNHG